MSVSSVNDLEDIVLFCNSDTVIDDFKDSTTQQANLSMLQS